MPPLAVLLFSQLLYTTSDLMGRHYMREQGFKISSFVTAWFLIFWIIRTVATMGQLYVLANFQVGKAMTLFSVTGLILANVLGFLLLGEVLSLVAYIGVMLALTAFLVVAFA